MVYRTFAFDVRNEAVRRALIMVHGTNRNADHYFVTATTAAFTAGALDDAIVERVDVVGDVRDRKLSVLVDLFLDSLLLQAAEQRLSDLFVPVMAPPVQGD